MRGRRFRSRRGPARRVFSRGRRRVTFRRGSAGRRRGPLRIGIRM